MNKKKIKQLLLIIMLAGSAATGACAKADDSTPTLSPEMIQTMAVATFSIGLTQTALAQPTATATETPSPTPTETPSPTPSPTAQIVILPTSSCNVLAFVADVTIPDNTKMSPGQTFTKTWRVKNTGTCAWEKDYQLKLFSGSAMGGTTLPLNKVYNTGATVDLSVEMTAPTKTGVYTGNWRMTDENGAFFGDSFYVLINVGEATPATTTVSSPSPSPSQEIPSETPPGL
jgi:cellulase/cellobiase CelA1